MGGVVDGIRSAADPSPSSAGRLGSYGLRSVLVGVLIALVALIGGSALALSADLQTLIAVRNILPAGHYLVLFQNNAELRPSGGFIGSFAVVDLDESGIASYSIDTNIYKRDKAFTDKYQIAMPGPLAQGIPGVSLAMRDANWDLDFQDAARRVAWFYEQEGGEAVDGVIAINASVVQDVLRLTGPIVLEELDEPLAADQFFEVLAQEIERDYYLDPAAAAANEPKSILIKLLPRLLERVRDPTVAAQLPRLAKQELDERHIQLFHYNPAVQQEVVGYGWAGTIAETAGDYLHLNNAQIVGLKSSLNIAQETELELTQQQDGTIKHALTVRRTHTGDGVWPDHRNNNYLRVVVPLGSMFVEARVNGEVVTAVDHTQEAGKTVFGLWLTTDPGHTSTLELHYVTPDSVLLSPYAFLYQKQSGVISEKVLVSLDGQSLFEGLVTTDLRL